MGEEKQENLSVTGIIAEYNPFHLGHAWQIAEIRRRRPDTAIVALMSGSFCQRGAAAILDKWMRARLAIEGGCDLVLELPFVFACRSAQAFATGGVQLLARLGLGGTLAFGAESDDLMALQRAASCMDDPALQARLHDRITGGQGYAAALAELLAERQAAAIDFRAPNNILGLEYLRALRRYPEIRPMLIPRRGAGHNDAHLPGVRVHREDGRPPGGGRAQIASGTAIRQEVYHAREERRLPHWDRLSPTLTAEGLAALQEAFPTGVPDAERMFPALQLSFLTRSDAAIDAIYGVNAAEGMTGRLRTAMREARSLQDFIGQAATRRYPAARIRRLVPFLLLGMTETDIEAMDAAGPLYARVLACGPRGRAVLHAARQTAQIPRITKTSRFLTTKTRTSSRALTTLGQQLAYDTLATDLRGLLIPARQPKNDFTTSPWFAARS